MKRILLFLTLLTSSNSFADLSCSANGLKVIYINGVNVFDPQMAQVAATTVNTIIKLQDKSLDLTHVFDAELVHNQSLGLMNDFEELKAQIAANHQGAKRLTYWREMAKSNLRNVDFAFKKKIDAALVQIESRKNILTDQDYYSQTDLYNDLKKLNSSIYPILANAASDVGVVEQLKEKIKAAYNGGASKLIVVAHSQGNEVLYSAIKELRSDRSFLATDNDIRKFDALVGYMQVAPPSPRLVTNTDNYFNYYPDHAQYIRHDNDLVIGGAFLFSSVNAVPPNYVAEAQVPSIFRIFDNNWLPIFFNTYGNNGITTAYHGMDDVYLSNSYKATRNQTGVNKPLVEHFKDNMREIASKLQDNCLPDANFTDHVNYLTNLKHDFSASLIHPNYNDQYTYSWNFGDGTTYSDVLAFSVSHLYQTYGTYQVTLNIYSPNSSKLISTYSKYISVDLDFNISVVTGSTSYTKVILIRDDAPNYSGGISERVTGIMHIRSASFKVQGPVGTSTSLGLPFGPGTATTLSCGNWTKIGNRCQRFAGQDEIGNLYARNVSQCGGEGCESVPLGNFYIPINPVEPESYHYTGPELPDLSNF